MISTRYSICLFIMLLMAFQLPGAETDFDAARLRNWHHWRGPYANGIAPEASPPVHWDADTNVKWVVPLPGQGASTPIVWEDRIFVLSALETDQAASTPPKKDERAMTEPPNRIYQWLVTCLDRGTGEILWQRVAREEAPHEGRHQTNTYAGGSPTTDGERLYVSFGSQGLYCYDFSGELLWERDLGQLRTRMGWGEASTPVLHQGNLIVPWDQEDQSHLFNLDPLTGKTRWVVDRDEPSNWSTPLILAEADQTQVVVNGTQRARGYALATGEVLWECGDLSVNAIPSPVAANGLIYCMSGYRKPVIYAIPYDARGDISGSEKIAWTYERNTPYVPSALLYDNKLFMTRDRSSMLTVLNASSGEPLLEAERLPGLGTVYSSPVLANERIYLLDREGNCAVIEPKVPLKILATNSLEGSFDASPVAVGRQLFLRSWTQLYCLEEI